MLKGMFSMNIVICMITAAVLNYQLRLYPEERVRLQHKSSSIQTDGPLARLRVATWMNIEWYKNTLTGKICYECIYMATCRKATIWP